MFARRQTVQGGTSGGQGFTLLEVMLVVALIGLLASLFFLNTEAFLRQTAMQQLESAYWESVREARQQALFTRQVQTLAFDREEGGFVLFSPNGKRVFALRESVWEARPEVAFLEELPMEGFRLVEGRLVTSRRVPQVQFFPDGTTRPFRVHLEAEGAIRQFVMDPWTGTELIGADRGETLDFFR